MLISFTFLVQALEMEYNSMTPNKKNYLNYQLIY
jgi:hypothetical protein